jgi:hypothetical protein
MVAAGEDHKVCGATRQRSRRVWGWDHGAGLVGTGDMRRVRKSTCEHGRRHRVPAQPSALIPGPPSRFVSKSDKSRCAERRFDLCQRRGPGASATELEILAQAIAPVSAHSAGFDQAAAHPS